jgi:hypothetical protein
MTLDSPAAAFRAMAERIGRNEPAEFGGAALIMPPGGGEAITILLIDPKRDVASFWGAVQGKVAIAVAEMQEAQNSPFGRR